MGDSDGFRLLMACEVLAAAAESRAITHWKSMFNVQADHLFSQA